MAVAVVVERGGFTVRFAGVDLLAACRRELVVPFDRVIGTRVLPRTDALASGPRLPCPGFSWADRCRVGCWGIGERRQLWSVRGMGEVVVVYLSGHPFHRVVVEVAEPRTLHRRLDAALLQSRKEGRWSSGRSSSTRFTARCVDDLIATVRYHLAVPAGRLTGSEREDEHGQR
jgi:hypothetical protein